MGFPPLSKTNPASRSEAGRLEDSKSSQSLFVYILKFVFELSTGTNAKPYVERSPWLTPL